MVAEVVQITESKKQIQHLNQAFEAQQAAFERNPMPSAEERIDNLNRLRRVLLDYQDRIIEAIHEDFSCRSRDETLLAELMPSLESIKYCSKRLRGWMKPSKREVSVLFQPASNKVVYQPKGVVGIIVPWNYPLYLAIGPMASALAAGNRIMVKMSEFTPAFSGLFAQMIAEHFADDLITVITGEADVAAEFSRKPYDHLLFTGSTHVGKHVMRAAAENLTPVTLELGGKSPAIVSQDVPMDDAVERICFGKSFNAGQTCVAPDYVLCPRDRLDSFIDSYKRIYAKMYPTLKDNNDYTAIINDRQHQRLNRYLEDAAAKGADIIELNPAAEDMKQDTRKMPLHLVTEVTDDMLVMQEEIFGPILPVVPYDVLADAIQFVNDRPRPLSLYFFSYDKMAQDQVLHHTHSGGVCLNESVMHVAQDDMPFGGIGPSGMGHYHGKEGFMTFSHHKGVFARPKFNSGKMVHPPYGSTIHNLIFKMFIR